MNRRWVFTFFTILCIIPLAGVAQSFSAKIIEVRDGDTVEIIRGGERQAIRLHGIDAPESDQPYGDQATRYLRRRVKGKTVTVSVVEKDRYGRLVATLEKGRK